MTIDPLLRDIFGRFQNLNLLFLLQDLRGRRTARSAWKSDKRLCPVAHGMPAAAQVEELRRLGENFELDIACFHAACHLGANSNNVHRFVRIWDSYGSVRDWLLRQLTELWEERLADAEAMQEMLAETQARCCAQAKPDVGLTN